MSANTRHILKGRKIALDMSQSPLHWIPGDADSSHLVNGIHLLLPAGELWFCRVFNQALPLVSDDILAEDVKGFIRQEALHAQAHRHGERWLQANGMDIEKAKGRADLLFEKLLSDKPLGVISLPTKALQKRWLIARVGLIATIEHFTGFLGDWCMNSEGWDKADPVVADLFRWHLAEEVEHRHVAFELFEHLCKTQLGFYLSRQALMSIVFPLIIYMLTDTARQLAGQDPDQQARKLARKSVLRILWEMERQSRRYDHTPTFTLMVERTLRWLSPKFDPINEGDTAQALAYIARSPAANAGAATA